MYDTRVVCHGSGVAAGVVLQVAGLYPKSGEEWLRRVSGAEDRILMGVNLRRLLDDCLE
jgi:hypothetical protein